MSLRCSSRWRIEADFNYGYSQGVDRYEITDFRDHATRFAETRREGWLAKALVEYETEWGIPGVFGWYGSGDDGNVGNGSERMPAISPCGNFTSFVGDDPYGVWHVGQRSERNVRSTVELCGDMGFGHSNQGRELHRRSYPYAAHRPLGPVPTVRR